MKGDGVTDDTAALVSALKSANGCRRWRGVDLCGWSARLRFDVPVDLKNATIKQTLAPFDTSKYIRLHRQVNPLEIAPADGLRAMMEGLPIMTAATTAIYPEDPVVTGRRFGGDQKMLNVRTFFVRGESGLVAVKLENVKNFGRRSSGNGYALELGRLYL